MKSRDLQKIQEKCDWETQPTLIKRLSGGDINDVFLIQYKEESIVVKKNEEQRFPKMLAKEYSALQFLADNTPIRYPKVKSAFEADGFQYLLMEYIAPGENTEKGQLNLGRLLAREHRVTNPDFGWEEDNYIGSLPQINEFKNKWSDFYAECRLLFQTKMAFDNRLVDSAFVTKMESFCYRLTDIFPEEKPALLHGDLWGGNYFFDKTDDPILYDPAVYFGHREVDIAMTRLFGGFSEAFYKAYNEEYPMEKGWEKRIEFGQLYPNMVHLNLFGPAYLSAVTSVINSF